MAVALLGISGTARAQTYPDPPPDFSHPETPHRALYSPQGGLTDRPMLVIYAEFADLTFADTSPSGLTAAYMADRFFGSFPSAADYFADESSGRLDLTPAAETSSQNGGAANDGVISVSIPESKSEFLELSPGDEIKRLLEAADPHVDFAAFDRDGDGSVNEDELVINRQDVDPDPAGAAGCGTTRSSAAVTLDGKDLGGLKMALGGTDTNLMTIVHETGHVAFDMPDLYFWNVGRFDLAGPTCGFSDDVLFRTNAWQKIHLGWTAPTVVTADGFYDVRRPPSSHDSAFVLYDPEKGTNHYFTVENRGRPAGTYDRSASDSGLVIWRLEDDEYTPNGAGEQELGPDGGFISLIRPDGGRAWDPSDASTPARTMERDWRDGTASQVAVRAIPAAAPTMRVFFDVRGPGVLVDALSDRGVQLRSEVIPEDENRPPVTAMNTGEQSDTFRFSYQGLPPGWDSITHSQALDDHEQVGSRAAVIPPADAEPGIYPVTIVGRSETDPSITSQASFELRVPAPSERIEDLNDDVRGAGLPRGTERSLSAKLQRALAQLEAGRANAACNTLSAFTNEVEALRGKKIPAATADEFLADARSIQRQIGCSGA